MRNRHHLRCSRENVCVQRGKLHLKGKIERERERELELKTTLYAR